MNAPALAEAKFNPRPWLETWLRLNLVPQLFTTARNPS